MENLINVQNDLYFRISKACINYKKIAKDRLTKEYLEGRIEAAEHLWFEFLAGHKEILRSQNIAVINASSYVKNDTYEKCDELFLDYKTELKTKLANFTVPKVSTEISKGYQKGKNVKLPKVNIDCFSGESYAEWRTFRDLFCSLIHNNEELDDVQKLLYLKGYLTGEAKRLLSNIPITQDNYVRAWELLEERYNNKKYIAYQILERLLNQRNIVQESASSLKGLLDTTNDCLAALSNIGIETESWDILVVYIVVKKLDLESRRQWEFSVSNDDLPTLDLFLDFLSKRYRALEFLEPRSNMALNSKSCNKPQNKIKAFHVAKHHCIYCSGEHTLVNCTLFQNEAIDSRRNFVQLNKICFCCLGSNHTAHTCKRNTKCRMCDARRHHTLLHQVSAHNAGGTTEAASAVTHKQDTILLATALVNAESRHGQRCTVRALLDQGSQASFVTESLVKKLRLRKISMKAQVSGIYGNKALVSKAIVYLKLVSRIDPQVVIKVKAHVLPSITTLQPTSQARAINWKELQEVVLADPEYHCPNQVEILLGTVIYGQILQEGIKKSPQGSLVAQCTSLGWILSGALEAANDTSNIEVMHSDAYDVPATIAVSHATKQEQHGRRNKAPAPSSKNCEDKAQISRNYEYPVTKNLCISPNGSPVCRKMDGRMLT